MHSSLTLRGNLTVIGACLLVAAGTAMFPGPFPAVAWTLAVLFGVTVGLLQAQSIGAAPAAYRKARTSVEVREALMSVRSGRTAVLIQWALVPLLIGAAWWQGNLLVGVLGGYALFMAVRDLVALKAVVGLASSDSAAS